jgi:hypothetical protein
VVSSTPRPHFTPGKDPVPILQEVGWAPGPVWTGGKSRPHLDSIPNRPTCSQSLYRLSYRAQRPDAVLHDKTEKTCLLIDVAISDDSNVDTKEAEKLSKYKDLKIDISRMWKLRTKIVPVIIGAL